MYSFALNIVISSNTCVGDLHRRLLSQLNFATENESQHIVTRLHAIENELKIFRSQQLLDERVKLRKKMVKIEELVKIYLAQVVDIVKNAEAVQCERKKMFSGRKSKVKESPNVMSYRISLLYQFIDVARKYCIVELINPPSKPSCTACDKEIVGAKENESYVCECGVMQDVIPYIEIEESPNLEKDRENLEKRINRFFGLLPLKANIPALIEKLDVYYMSQRKPKGSEVRNMQLGMRANHTNKSRLRIALSEISESKLYADINLIAYEYWGTPLPPLIDKEQILVLHDIFCFHYRNMYPEKSLINADYLLAKYFLIIGYKFDVKDLKLPEPVTISSYEEIFELICARAKAQDPTSPLRSISI